MRHMLVLAACASLRHISGDYARMPCGAGGARLCSVHGAPRTARRDSLDGRLSRRMRGLYCVRSYALACATLCVSPPFRGACDPSTAHPSMTSHLSCHRHRIYSAAPSHMWAHTVRLPRPTHNTTTPFAPRTRTPHTNRYTIAAPSGRRRSAIGAPCGHHRGSMWTPPGRRHTGAIRDSIGAPSEHNSNTIDNCSERQGLCAWCIHQNLLLLYLTFSR